MTAEVRTRVVTPQAWTDAVRRLLRVYAVYYRHLKRAVEQVGWPLAAHVDCYWGPWMQAFARRERIIRRTLIVREYERPHVTPVGNLHDLVAHVPKQTN